MTRSQAFMAQGLLLAIIVADVGEAFTSSITSTGTTGRCRTDNYLWAFPVNTEEQGQVPSWKRRLLSAVQETLWPGSQPDPSVTDASLPPGSLGCPFFGSDGFLSGNSKDGPGCFFRQAAKAAGDPHVYQFYFFGGPVASVSGKALVSEVTSMEFDQLEALSATYNDGATPTDVESGAEVPPTVFGNDNAMFERDREKHAFLRRIMKAGMTASTIQEAFPIVHAIAQQRIEQILSTDITYRNGGVVHMETICTEYSLDVTQKQVLGLELPPDEVSRFRESMTTWLSALYSPLANLNMPWLVPHLPEFKAKKNIEEKIEQKIDALLEAGTPDASVLSKMLFAVDAETNNQKLTRSQVVENALMLMIAGSETTSGSLTLMMLMLGLHPHVLHRLQEEQDSIVREFGPNLQLSLLDEHHAPYLNAVMKETLRMGPLTGGFPKRTTETIVVDGYQIPKGWSVFSNIRLTHQLDPSTKLDNDAHMSVHTGFHPERWLSPDTVPQEYIPFGTGPRHCIGAPLAVMQIQLFLATLARRVYSFDLMEDYTDQKPVVWNPSTMVPRPKDGVNVQNCVPRSMI